MTTILYKDALLCIFLFCPLNFLWKLRLVNKEFKKIIDSFKSVKYKLEIYMLIGKSYYGSRTNGDTLVELGRLDLM